MRQPFSYYLLIFLVIFQAISGLIGGTFLIADTSGESLNMPLSMLHNTPFHSYLIPGLVLGVFLGLFPAFIAWGLISKARIAFTQKLNTHKTIHWAITFSLYLGIMLILWIDFQIMWIGYGHFIQSIYAFLGVAIVVMSLWPTHWKPQ